MKEKTDGKSLFIALRARIGDEPIVPGNLNTHLIPDAVRASNQVNEELIHLSKRLVSQDANKALAAAVAILDLAATALPVLAYLAANQ